MSEIIKNKPFKEEKCSILSCGIYMQFQEENKKLANRVNSLLIERNQTNKLIFQSLQYIQSIKSSVLSGLRNTKEFDTQKDRNRHLTKLSNIFKNIERLEFELKKIGEFYEKPL